MPDASTATLPLPSGYHEAPFIFLFRMMEELQRLGQLPRRYQLPNIEQFAAAQSDFYAKAAARKGIKRDEQRDLKTLAELHRKLAKSSTPSQSEVVTPNQQ
jgi:hypothetical protein